MTNIRFGTDGWRGLIARDFTFDNVALCAQGMASYLQKEGEAEKGVVVGYDTRFASREFAECVAEVLVGNGIRVALATSPAPTPVISYQVLLRKAAGAAIITASHNSALWNGFKYKPSYAGSATPEITNALEAEIECAQETGPHSLPLEVGRKEGLVEDIDPMPPYLDHLQNLVDIPALASAGLSVQVDAMYGAGAGYLPALLYGGSTHTAEIHGQRNPAFPGISQPEPIEKNLGQLSTAVTEQGSDVGIALDGDADRVGVVDEKGTFLTSLQVFALLALYLLETEGRRGALVKSLTSTSMVHRLGERHGVPVFETPVGFKYIGPIMMQEDALIGGEESGGFGFRGHIPERDGILSGLYFLSLMAKMRKSPSELVDYLYGQVGPHHYRRLDVPFHSQDRERLQRKLLQTKVQNIGGLAVVASDDLDGRRFVLPNAWVVVRFSGTEPLLRIYGEAESPEKVQQILQGHGHLPGNLGETSSTHSTTSNPRRVTA